MLDMNDYIPTPEEIENGKKIHNINDILCSPGFNNHFNERLSNELPHDFTINDIDCFITRFMNGPTLMLFVEYKHNNGSDDKISRSQYNSLKHLNNVIKILRSNNLICKYSKVLLIIRIGNDKYEIFDLNDIPVTEKIEWIQINNLDNIYVGYFIEKFKNYSQGVFTLIEFYEKYIKNNGV